MRQLRHDQEQVLYSFLISLTITFFEFLIYSQLHAAHVTPPFLPSHWSVWKSVTKHANFFHTARDRCRYNQPFSFPRSTAGFCILFPCPDHLLFTPIPFSSSSTLLYGELSRISFFYTKKLIMEWGPVSLFGASHGPSLIQRTISCSG